MMSRMKESHRKGVVTHPDPESCTVRRETGGEAWTGARTGRVWSCERKTPGCRSDNERRRPHERGRSRAGFTALWAGARPQPPGGRRAIPADFRYRLAVSRRTPVVCSIRRSDQPSRPRAIACCCFSSLKTLLTLTERNPPSGSMSWFSSLLAGLQVATYGRFWVATDVLA